MSRVEQPSLRARNPGITALKMSVEKIKEYCRRLGKHSDNKEVLKETLYKLNKMEVTVDILQETGIGE